MDRNVTIRRNDTDIERWRKVAELSNQSLNVWIVKTLNLEASIMEEALVVQYAGVTFGCCSWQILDLEGNLGGTVKVRMEDLSLSKNAIFDIFNKDGEKIGAETRLLGLATRKEIGETVVRILEGRLVGVKLILNLNKILTD